MISKKPVRNKKSTKKSAHIIASKAAQLASIPQPTNPPGMRLISWLWDVAEERGLNQEEIATELGITYGYLSQLKKGFPRSGISAEFARSCARFIGVPVISILISADQISIEDFMSPDVDFDYEIDQALNMIKKDQDWGPFVPRDIKTASVEYKQLIVLLYEAATGRCILPDKVDLESLLKSVK